MEENEKPIGQHEARDQHLSDAAPWSDEIKYDPEYHWCQCEACKEAEAAAFDPFAGRSAHGHALLAFDAVSRQVLDKLEECTRSSNAEANEALEELRETLDEAVIAALLAVGVNDDCPVRMPFKNIPAIVEVRAEMTEPLSVKEQAFLDELDHADYMNSLSEAERYFVKRLDDPFNNLFIELPGEGVRELAAKASAAVDAGFKAAVAIPAHELEARADAFNAHFAPVLQELAALYAAQHATALQEFASSINSLLCEALTLGSEGHA